MVEFNYKDINKVIEEYVIENYNDDFTWLNNLDYIINLSYSYLNIYKYYLKIDKNINLSVIDSIEMVRSFLEQFDASYLKKFDLAIQDGTINLYDYDDADARTSFGKVGYEAYLEGHNDVNIPLKHDIFDPFKLIHEFFHLTNEKGDLNSPSRDFLTETSSITAEMLFSDYLRSKYHLSGLEYEPILFRFNKGKSSAKEIIVSSYLLKIYLKYHDINEDSIVKMNFSSRQLFQENCTLIFKQYRDNFDGYMNASLKYFLGTVFANHISTQIEEGILSYRNFIDFNDELNDLNPLSSLKKVGVDLGKSETFDDMLDSFSDKISKIIDKRSKKMVKEYK